MSSAAAFTKTPDGKCCTVKIEQTPACVKLLFKHTGRTENVDDVLAGLSPSKTNTVLGIDPPGIAFYNIEIPQVPDAQLDSLVRMQAETILPLPLEQMEIAFQRGRVVADKCRITIAAGRSAQLSGEMAFAKKCNAKGIVLNCQAVVKAFDTLFDIPQQKYIILNMRKNDTQVLLSEDGKLAGAARLDIGIDDLNDTDRKCGEMFVYDLRNTLDMLGLDSAEETALYVFSESNALSETIAAGLNDVRISAKAAEMNPHAITSETPLTEEETCLYLEAIGCALLTLDEENRPLDLFSELYNIDKKKKKASAAAPLIKAAAIFAVMLLATFFTFNQTNKMELAKYKNDKINKLVEQQNIRKLIASQRPDILNLFTLINEEAPGGVTVDSISFKKGEKVTIKSRASSHDHIIKMEKFLSSKKNFTDVTRQNPTYDEKGKKYTFKINFHYKNWTRKSAR